MKSDTRSISVNPRRTSRLCGRSILRQILFIKGSIDDRLDVLHGIERKRHQHDADAHANHDHGHRLRNIVPDQMHRHHRIQGNGGQLAVPYRALDGAGAFDGDQAGYRRADFLHHQQNQRIDHIAKARNKAEQHRRLRKLIRDGIERLAEIADHIKFARNDTIRHIGNARQDQNDQRAPIILLFNVQPDDHRNQQKPKQGHQVRDGQYFLLILVR